MRIGELSARCGLPARTIRFYEARHLVPPPRRTTAGYRDYDDDAVARLRFVRDAQTAGLTLSEIATIIELREAGVAPCEHVSRLLDCKLADVREHIASLHTLEADLVRLVDRARTLDPARCVDPAICNILQA